MIRACLSLTFLLTAGMSGAVDFKPPTAVERARAIGPAKGLPAILAAALDPDADFEPIPVPRPGDWLAVHAEPGQTFEEFVRSGPNRPDKVRNKIYLRPLGKFPTEAASLVDTLRAYAAGYFAMEVAVLPPIELTEGAVTARRNPYTQHRQIRSADVLDLLKKDLPADAFCLLAITMEDLYPDPSWNFVFGQASLQERVGVYSFARYDPAFYGEPRGANYLDIVLRRSGRVLVHETAHMFGLTHCIYFKCVLNGSNHLPESDSRPLHLCPVCLHKLQYSIGFDLASRYRKLREFYERVGFEDEARWTARRLEKVEAAAGGR
jgi:archaemetzincin